MQWPFSASVRKETTQLFQDAYETDSMWRYDLDLLSTEYTQQVRIYARLWKFSPYLLISISKSARWW